MSYEMKPALLTLAERNAQWPDESLITLVDASDPDCIHYWTHDRAAAIAIVMCSTREGKRASINRGSVATYRVTVTDD